MNYDVVIATRNRASSLLRCVECLERQTELPVRVIIVDASDQPEAVRSRVMTDRTPDIEWHWLQSPVRSAVFQRNMGLERVASEVVLMPDDDSLLYPDAAAEMLAAYRLDTEGIFAGVSATGAGTSPLSGAAGQMSRAARLQARLLPWRNRIERLIVPRPFETYPHSLWRERVFPPWVDGDAYALVETIGGYLLSLRTECARSAGFDEVLGYGIGYSLHEDMEMSMRLQRAGKSLVAAHRAQIFHDVHPARRAGGFAYGFCWIANYIYACARNIPRDTAAWRQMSRFLRYKILLYRIRALVKPDAHNHDIHRGAKAAWSQRAMLIDAAPDELVTVYKQLCDRWLRG